jgi:hypothetical protein
MATEEEVAGLLDRVEKATEQKKIDLSSDEGLSIAIMNLIVSEEHLFFTAEKTNKESYYDLLDEVRTMRKDLMKEMIKDVEGETWCITKHLMGASMRLMESGTKQLHKGNREKAKELFHKSYQLYSLFWAINLDIVSAKDAKEKEDIICSVCGIDDPAAEAAPKKVEAPPERLTNSEEKKKADNLGKKDFMGKIGDLVSRVVNCCKE